MTHVAKTIGALATSSMLIAGGVATVGVPLANADQVADAPLVQASDAAASAVETVAVQGAFSYDQGRTVDNGTIQSAFVKATASLCSPSAAAFGVDASGPIGVFVEGVQTMSAVVSEMASEQEADVFIMGCACSSNPAGGGAIMNAEVEGVSLEQVMSQAYAGQR